jgi:hypothetical protein
MASATKIGSMVPTEWVGAVTERMPDHLPSLPDVRMPDINVGDLTGRVKDLSGHVRDIPVPFDVSEVGERVKDITGTAAATVKDTASRAGGLRRLAIPVGLGLVLAVVFMVMRSRRSHTEVPAAENPNTYAHL